MRISRQIRAGLIALTAALLLVGCGAAAQDTETTSQATLEGPIMNDPGTYDSADTAVLYAIDEAGRQITFYNTEHDKYYTLEYNGATCFYDKYGSGISLSQLEVGEIVDLTFYKAGKRLNTMQRSPNAWSYDDWTNYALDVTGTQMVIGSSVMTVPANIKVLSHAEEITMEDLDPMDAVTIRGLDSKVCSIVVESGHGYLRLENDAFFYGGWIEVGTKVISKVEENLLLTVPEGTQNVVISNKGVSGSKTIHVERGKELSLDVGDLQGEVAQEGTVIFTITPENANLYIDGTRTEYATPVKLTYGIHQLIVRAEGYQTVTQYLKVGQESAGINVELQPNENAQAQEETTVSETDVSGNNTSSQTTETTSTSGYYVTITAPADVEIYLDGNYVGLAPCEFKKEAGLHTILLRKSGYQSKTYTVQIDSEDRNISYAFPDLTAE